jgi:hypothetical protein
MESESIVAGSEVLAFLKWMHMVREVATLKANIKRSKSA